MRTWMKRGYRVAAALLLTAMFAGGAAAVDQTPWIEGECMSLGQTDGLWTYRLSLAWDTGKHGVSHIDVILDDSGNCTAGDMEAGLFFDIPAGTGAGVPEPCMVEYVAAVEQADPSIDLLAVVLKYEPRSAGGCEPGQSGMAMYEFQSPFPPAPIALENLFLVQKFSTQANYGSLTGVFPGLPCDPVPAETGSWGELKARFR